MSCNSAASFGQYKVLLIIGVYQSVQQMIIFISGIDGYSRLVTYIVLLTTKLTLFFNCFYVPVRHMEFHLGFAATMG